MNHPLIEIKIIDQSPGDFLRSIGQVFAVFDERTQDSGNISYGVLASDRRFFVKTAGMPENSKAHLLHEQRSGVAQKCRLISPKCQTPQPSGVA
jgi:serine/threonine-protein kinase